MSSFVKSSKFLTLSFLLFLSTFPNLTFASDEVSIITNLKASRELETGVQEMPLKEDVYDLSFTAYDADFASEFGLQEKNITNLDAGMRFIELRLITEGSQTNCYYNVILDKSLKLDFPEEDYLPNSTPEMIGLSGSGKKFPKNFDPHTDPLVQKAKKLTDLRSQYSWEYSKRYMNRTALGNRDYKFHKSGKPFSDGIASSASLLNYAFSRSTDFNLLRIKGMCIGKMYDYPDFSLWLRKKGHDSSKGLNKEDYHVLVIPESITKRIKPISEQVIKRKNNNKKQGE